MHADQSNLTAIGDLNPAVCGSVLRSISFNLLDNVVAFGDLSKNDVLLIQPRGLSDRDEELRTVSVGSRIGHRQQTFFIVLFREVFIRELLTVDGLASGAVEVGEVSSLQHES